MKRLIPLSLLIGIGITLLAATPAYSTTVSHPAGCPWSKFCGCGVSVKVFGHPVRSLFAAISWSQFQPTYARGGAVAYRAHHVVYIERMTGPHRGIVYDPNSGHHQTRVHERDLRGFRFVDPYSRQIRTYSARRHYHYRYHRRHRYRHR